MQNLKGTKTEKNLLEAFAGESMARNKYTYFASKAKKDGFVQISKIFEETADNEKEHAKMWYKYLNGLTEPLYKSISAVNRNMFRATLLDSYSEVILNAKGEVMR